MYALGLLLVMVSVVVGGPWGMSPGEAAMVAVGRGRGRPGGSVSVAVKAVRGRGEEVVGLSADIRFDPAVLGNPRCKISRRFRGEGVGKRDRGRRLVGTMGTRRKTVVCSEPAPGLLRLGVFGLNLAPIPRGRVATVTFDILPGAAPGRYELAVSPDCAGPAGETLPVAGKNGTVRVIRARR